MRLNDGGPAFPGTWWDRDSMGEIAPRESDAGMTLRDYFAAKALEGFMVNQGWIGYMDTPEHRAFLLGKFAEDSYAIADAMLKEREAVSEK